MGGAGFLATPAARALIIQENLLPFESGLFRLINRQKRDFYGPLDTVELESDKTLEFRVLDGQGRMYHKSENTTRWKFTVAGSLGNQLLIGLDRRGRLQDLMLIPVNTHTFIEDEHGEYRDILAMLHRTMHSTDYGNGRRVYFNGKYYNYFSSWFQDHYYIMKGQRYFYPEWKSGVDLYADAQREDGMIHDNYKHPYTDKGAWSQRFDYGNFVYVPEDPLSDHIFVRVPVENMAEFTFLEAIYEVWRLTGDDEWMKGKLDRALKALHYSTRDPYRWSEEYRLLKRAYTIDIWDFQVREDMEKAGNDTMVAKLGITPFGIMYGDNVRMAAGCKYLAAMLTAAGWLEEAAEVAETGRGIKERIDALSWNGEFYRHRVPIEPEDRDLGVDETKQVTLSNGWALSAELEHDKSVAIIKTYQRIRKEMPGSSPGEWYCCYPPFERGFTAGKWQYMNGGVTPILAGELIHGAFEHGFEDYAIDILKRLYKLSARSSYILQGCYRGKMPGPPERSFRELDILKHVNVDLEDGNEKVPGWMQEAGNDMKNFPLGEREYHGIPFRVIDPAQNDRGAVIGISGRKGYTNRVSIPVGQKAASVYFLHTQPWGNVAGHVELIYADGEKHIQHIGKPGIFSSNGEIGPWWFPSVPYPRKGMPHTMVAWTGDNERCINIGCYVFGMNHPHPGKSIKEIRFTGMQDESTWMIMGITLCDKPVFFMPNFISTIPRHWAAAEVTFGLMEGLVGIKNTGKAFDEAELNLRWQPAGVNRVQACAKYEASGGYLQYRYRFDPGTKDLECSFTGQAELTRVRIYIPGTLAPERLLLNGREIEFEIEKVENSRYLVAEVAGTGPHRLKLHFAQMIGE